MKLYEIAKLIGGKIYGNEEIDISISDKEKELRNEVANDDKYNVFDKAESKVSYVLFAPVSGKITKSYNVASKNLSSEDL